MSLSRSFRGSDGEIGGVLALDLNFDQIIVDILGGHYKKIQEGIEQFYVIELSSNHRIMYEQYQTEGENAILIRLGDYLYGREETEDDLNPKSDEQLEFEAKLDTATNMTDQLTMKNWNETMPR